MNGSADDHWEVLRDETKVQSDKALWMQVQDLVKAALAETLFQRLLRSVRETARQPIAGNPGKAVEVTADKFRLTEAERGSVLRHLITGGTLTR